MQLKQSEIVVFDPSNESHRKAVQSFMKRNAWGDTTYRFAYDPSYGSVAQQVQSKMLQWYMSNDADLKAELVN